MMSLAEIRQFYPENLHSKSAFLLREYLQCKILELLFESPYAAKFAFLGGTCLRIVHGSQRFSEDLDFDNFALSETDFGAVSELILKGLERQGFRVEMRNVLRGAYHCYIRFPGLLFETGLSEHREARVLINLDTEPQGFVFEPNLFYLNRFDVFTGIRTTPLDILLSQKFYAITNRRQPKGRDFFDAVFLLARTSPNYAFLQARLQISTPTALKEHLLSICEKLDFQMLAADVQPFLFDPLEVRRVLAFPQIIRDASL
jgi:predicted nucleotidyltransferase component of viral defense system